MAVVLAKSTAKGCESPCIYVLAPSNAARGFSRLPFGTPQSQIRHLSSYENGAATLAHDVILSAEWTRCPQLAPASFAGFRSLEKHSD